MNGPDFEVSDLNLDAVPEEDRVSLTELQAASPQEAACTKLDPLPTDFGQTKRIFKVLSPVGLGKLRAEIERLEPLAVESPRIPKVLRGTAYHSKFICDLCTSPRLTAFLSNVAGTELVPHPMKIMHGHVNLAPKDKSRAVDRWHVDTVPFVLVLFVTDPDLYTGGEWERARGRGDTQEKRKDPSGTIESRWVSESRICCVSARLSSISSCAKSHQRRSADNFVRIDIVEFFVYLLVPPTSCQTSTSVQSYVATNPLAREACYKLSDTYNNVDPLEKLLPDWARFRCWKSSRICEYVHSKLDGEVAQAVLEACETLKRAYEECPYGKAGLYCRNSTADYVRLAAKPLALALDAVRSRDASCWAISLLEKASSTLDQAITDVLSLQGSSMKYY
eukprot:UC4_evm1s1428